MRLFIRSSVAAEVVHEYAASVWTIMERYGDVLVPDELNGSDIHRLENIITMETAKHDLFDTLQLWLEATVRQQYLRICESRAELRLNLQQTLNRYKVCCVYPDLIRRIPQFVTLTSPNVTNLPVPSPRYLRLHVSCCRVAHLSGAGECIDKIFGDMNEGLVLAADGASADALAFALEGAIISVH